VAEFGGPLRDLLAKAPAPADVYGEVLAASTS
jgi:hypothetical protein